jgi:hypothetical protein
MRKFSGIGLLLGVCGAARAEGGEPVAAETSAVPVSRRLTTVNHHAGAYLSGALGGVALGYLGVVVGYAAAGPCVDDPFGSCFLHGVGSGIVGGVVGTNVGVGAGVYGYGAATGHQGSLWGALAGTAATAAMGLALTSVIPDGAVEPGLVATGALMPGTALLGYKYCYRF